MCFAVTPANDTIPLIDIPEWDFHWQGIYSLPRVLKLPLGTTVYSSAFYDNTPANPENPNSPPQLVTLDEATTDEMMLIYFAYTFYLPGDENIIIDTAFYTGIQPIANSAISTPQLYDPVPNPSNDFIQFQYFLPNVSSAVISILDVQGKTVMVQESEKNFNGLATAKFDISKLRSGIYFINLNADGVMRTKRFIRQ
jgi:hypothetical protein